MNVYTELEVRIPMSCSLVWSQANPQKRVVAATPGLWRFGMCLASTSTLAFHCWIRWQSISLGMRWPWYSTKIYKHVLWNIVKYCIFVFDINYKIVKYCEVHLSLCCICRSWVKFLHADFMTERKTADSPLKPQLIFLSRKTARAMLPTKHSIATRVDRRVPAALPRISL